MSPDIPFIVTVVYIEFCIVIVALELESTTRAVRKLIIKFIIKNQWRQNGRETYDSGRKYNKAWESKFSWVSQASDGSEDAFCKLCHASMKPKQSNLTKHEKSDKHMQRVKLSTTTKPIQVVRVPKIADEVKVAEIELAVTMACHSAILTMDHLGEVITRNAQGSKLGDIKMHRRKCTKILTNIVSPALKEELIADVQGKKFALIVDESTDVSTAKQLCVILRYYSEVEKKILTAFVDLVPVIHTCADDLFNAIRDCLSDIKLDLVWTVLATPVTVLR